MNVQTILSAGPEREHRVLTLSPAAAVGSTDDSVQRAVTTPHALYCFKTFSAGATSTLRCGEAEWRGLWRSTWGSPRGMSARRAWLHASSKDCQIQKSRPARTRYRGCRMPSRSYDRQRFASHNPARLSTWARVCSLYASPL